MCFYIPDEGEHYVPQRCHFPRKQVKQKPPKRPRVPDANTTATPSPVKPGGSTARTPAKVERGGVQKMIDSLQANLEAQFTQELSGFQRKVSSLQQSHLTTQQAHTATATEAQQNRQMLELQLQNLKIRTRSNKK